MVPSLFLSLQTLSMPNTVFKISLIVLALANKQSNSLSLISLRTTKAESKYLYAALLGEIKAGNLREHLVNFL